MEAVIKPAYQVLYNSKDITVDISDSLSSLSYTDKIKAASDEISISIQDLARKWMLDWFPAKGDKIKLLLGYPGEMLNCGTFQVDELSFTGPPDVVTIRAMAAPIGKDIRTKKSSAHENKTLKEIAEKIATDHGLKLVGTINDKFTINRKTQYRETDLNFLRRTAFDFGYIFSVRNDQLIFSSLPDLEATTSALEIHRNEITPYSFKDSATGNYKKVTVSYNDPVTNNIISATATSAIEGKKDTFKIFAKVDNVGQAKKMAESILLLSSRTQTGRCTIKGNPKLVAGININLIGFGRLSGKVQIEESTHIIDSSGGYKTSFSFKKIGPVSTNKWL